MFRSNLYVSDTSKVISFNEDLFDWRIEPADEGNHIIYNKNDEEISSIRELTNNLRSKYQYWAVTFYTDNIEQVKEVIVENGGEIYYQEGEKSIWVNDPCGAFFNLVQR